MKKLIASTLLLLCSLVTINAAVYEVRPNTALDTIAEVPWDSLQPGDTVLIYWKPDPYKEKWVICRQGTAAQPITIRGVLGPNGERPTIDGNGATTPTYLNYWNENRGTIKIGGANVPADTMPRHITIENLEIRGAHQSYQFTRFNGQTQTYAQNAAAIYVEKVETFWSRRITSTGTAIQAVHLSTITTRRR